MELFVYDGGSYECIGQAERANASYSVGNLAFRGKDTKTLRDLFVNMVNGAYTAARVLGRSEDLRFCLRDGLAAVDYEFTHQNAVTTWHVAARYGS